MSKNILVDCDDTIVNLLTRWVEELNKRFNTNVKESDIKCWDMCKAFPTLTHDQLVSPLITKGFWGTIPAKKDAQQIIPKLQEEGYNIYVVTATDSRNFSEKVEQLILKQFPTLNRHNIISCYNKQLLNGDILIDDNVENLIGGTYQKILYTSQHNKAYENIWPYSDIHRANCWEDCYNLIHKLV